MKKSFFVSAVFAAFLSSAFAADSKKEVKAPEADVVLEKYEVIGKKLRNSGEHMSKYDPNQFHRSTVPADKVISELAGRVASGSRSEIMLTKNTWSQ